MITAGIKELRNSLSHYLSFVKKGEEILITERGKVFARIIQEDPDKINLRRRLDSLLNRGLITLPAQQLGKDIHDPVKVSGRPVSDIVIEDRR